VEGGENYLEENRQEKLRGMIRFLWKGSARLALKKPGRENDLISRQGGWEKEAKDISGLQDETKTVTPFFRKKEKEQTDRGTAGFGDRCWGGVFPAPPPQNHL